VPVHLLEYVYPDGRIERKPAEYVDGEMIRTGVVFISDDGADWIVQTVLPHNRYAAKFVLRKPNDSRLSDASSPQRLAVRHGRPASPAPPLPLGRWSKRRRCGMIIGVESKSSATATFSAIEPWPASPLVSDR
jgi:hypothetical protein